MLIKLKFLSNYNIIFFYKILNIFLFYTICDVYNKLLTPFLHDGLKYRLKILKSLYSLTKRVRIKINYETLT